MAYKTFANGFPLPASDLNNYLMNQSVIVFADSTARTAALPTPTEGMITYLEDTNNYQYWDSAAWVDLVEAPDLSTLIPKSTVTTAGDLIVADGASSVTRLGVGTDDQVLTLVSGEPAWADAAGGGGITLINSGSVASSTLSLTSIPGTYKDLVFVVNGATTATSMQFDNTSNNYSWIRERSNGTSPDRRTAQTSMPLTFFNASSSGSSIMTIKDYASGFGKSVIGSGIYQNDAQQIFAGYQSGSPITRIDTLTASTFTYFLYGVN